MSNSGYGMKISKSSRHSKITGDFAERLVLYWLSKYGFECAYVDHTGLDIIARNPHSGKLMGISVKSRSRSEGTEGTGLRIAGDELPRLESACRAFGCEPYFALVVDSSDRICVWIVGRRRFLDLCDWKRGGHVYWKMGKKRLELYARDPRVMAFEFRTKTLNWWKKTSRSAGV